jgi:hypothetical protein
MTPVPLQRVFLGNNIASASLFIGENDIPSAPHKLKLFRNLSKSRSRVPILSSYRS